MLLGSEEAIPSVGWHFVQRAKVLGHGGFGVVYEGVDKHTGKLVALKMLQVLSLCSVDGTFHSAFHYAPLMAPEAHLLRGFVVSGRLWALQAEFGE